MAQLGGTVEDMIKLSMGIHCFNNGVQIGLPKEASKCTHIN